MQTEDICPATTDFKVMKEKKLAFEGIEGEIEVIGIVSCGGCPGKKQFRGLRKWSDEEPIRSFLLHT